MLERFLNIGLRPEDNILWQKRRRFLNTVLLSTLSLAAIIAIVSGIYSLFEKYFLIIFYLDLLVLVLLVLGFFVHDRVGYKAGAWWFLLVMAVFFSVLALLLPHLDIEFFLLVLMVFGFAFFDSREDFIVSGILNFGLFALVRIVENKISVPSLAFVPSPLCVAHFLMFLVMAILVWTLKNDALQHQSVIDMQNKELARKNRELFLQKQMVETLYNNLIDSIAYAQRIQFSFFPDRSFLSARLGEYGLVFLPKEGISGDFYMLCELGGDDVVLLGDSTGHGMSGALLAIMFMVTLKQVFEKAKEDNWQVVDILEEMRCEIKANLRHFSQDRDEGADVALVRISRDRKKLVFAGANMDLYIIRSGVLYVFKGVRSPIGFYFKELVFEQEEFDLEPGDRIILFTDGVVDQISPRGRRFSTARFKKILLDTGELSPQEQAGSLLEIFFDWKGDNLQTDDLTILIFDV